MLLHKHNNKPVITIIGKHAKEQFDKALDLAFKEQSNRPIVVETPLPDTDKHHKSLHNLPQAYHNTPSLTNKRDTADGLQGNFVDDKTPHFTPTSYDIAIPKISEEQKQLIKVYGTSGNLETSFDTHIKGAKEHIEQLKEIIFPYTNPFAEPKQLSDVEYYKQNAEVYLKEYLLIQQKISKLSSTKRRQIVHIVETYLLT